MLIQITEQSMVPMVMIREDNEQKPRKVPLYSQRENSQWDQWLLSENTTKKTKQCVISIPIQKTEQPMEPMVMIREHNEQKPRKMSYLFSNREQPMEPMV